MQKAVRRITDARVGTLLFCLCWGAYFLAYCGRLNYTAVMAQIIAEGTLTKTHAGMLGTVCFFSYAAGQLLSGFLGDRVSPRLLIFAGLAASGLCNLGMAAARTYPLLLLLWGANGLAQSFLWPPLMRIFCERYEDRVRVRACVQINTSVPAGTLAAYAFAAWAVAHGGWRVTFWVAGGVLCVFAVVWLVLLARIEAWAQRHGTDAPPLSAAPQKQAGGRGLWTGLALLCAALAIQGALKDGVTGWAPVYLGEAYGLGASAAILSTMAIPVLNIFGMYMASHMMKKRTEIPNAVLLYLACGGAVLALGVYSGASALPALGLLALSTTAMMAVNTLLISLYPARFRASGQVARVCGVLNFCVYMGSALSTTGIGALAELAGWRVTIFVWAALAVLGAALCARTERRQQEEERL